MSPGRATTHGESGRRARTTCATAELAAAISEIYTASRGIYGAPKVFQELKKAGVRTSRKRVARIMRDNGWAGTTRGCAKRPKGEAKQAAPQPCAAPDLVRRDFAAGGRTRCGSRTSPT